MDPYANVPKGWIGYKIFLPDDGPDNPIDELRVNEGDADLVGISYAYNAEYDNREGRLALRDLILGF